MKHTKKLDLDNLPALAGTRSLGTWGRWRSLLCVVTLLAALPSHAEDYVGTCQSLRVAGANRTSACSPNFTFIDGRYGARPTLRFAYSDGGREVPVVLTFDSIENTPNVQLYFSSIAVAQTRYTSKGACGFVGLGMPAGTTNLQFSCRVDGTSSAMSDLYVQFRLDVAKSNERFASAGTSTGGTLPADQLLALSIRSLAATLSAAPGPSEARRLQAAAPSQSRSMPSGRPSLPANSFIPSDVASDDHRAIFGLLVGGTLSARRCRENEDLRPNQLWCFSVSPLEAQLAEWGDPMAEAYRKLGGRLWSIEVNATVFDTSLLFALPLLGTANHLQAWVTSDPGSGAAVIQAIELNPRLDAVDSVVAMLTDKFGSPSSRESTSWTSRHTGEIVARTPNVRWSKPPFDVVYESRIADVLANPGSMGSIKIVSSDFRRRALQWQKDHTPPPKRGM